MISSYRQREAARFEERLLIRLQVQREMLLWDLEHARSALRELPKKIAELDSKIVNFGRRQA
ncbi:hypothetical protein J4419_05065 [Candidatus Woesearchaeota archaeon]|nr:hypothetical protein [Candidatus Woesearchaeota archaeon]